MLQGITYISHATWDHMPDTQERPTNTIKTPAKAGSQFIKLVDSLSLMRRNTSKYLAKKACVLVRNKPADSINQAP